MTLEQLDAEVVVASDIHLLNLESSRGQMILTLLENLSNQVEYLVLNGDIFDFCFGKSKFFRRKFAKLGAALTCLAAKGVQIVFVEGNHEFSMTQISWGGVQFVGERTKIIQTKSGLKIALTHGDLLLNDPKYQLFRNFLKSETTINLAGKIPGQWLDSYALKHAKVSRSRDVYRRVDHKKVVDAAFKWLGSTEAQLGIFGHFHIPYAEATAMNGTDYRIFCVESWDRPNLLVIKQGRPLRAYLEPWISSRQWTFIEPEPILK
jgi:UDP-2,3-diacylglucosamine hydrolase